MLIFNYQSVKNYDKEWFDQFWLFNCLMKFDSSKVFSIKTEIYDKVTNAEYFKGLTGITYPKKNIRLFEHIVLQAVLLY